MGTTVIDGICHWCNAPVKITKYDPPKKTEDKEGEYLLLDSYTCGTCGIESEHTVRRVI